MSGVPQGQTFDIYVRCGDRYELIIDITTDDGKTPVDTTGWTGAAKAKDYKGVTLVTFTVTITAGVLKMTATATQTAEITGDGEYQLTVSDGNLNGRTTLLWGQMITKKAIA